VNTIKLYGGRTVDIQDYFDWIEQMMLKYPGVISNEKWNTWMGRATTRVTAGWATHTSIGLGAQHFGDAQWPKAKLTYIDEKRDAMKKGKLLGLRLYLPMNYQYEAGLDAALTWSTDIKGKWYDWRGVFYVLYRRLGLTHKARHITWAWFCTEGVSKAYVKLSRYVFGKAHAKATPRTVERRGEEGLLKELRYEGEEVLVSNGVNSIILGAFSFEPVAFTAELGERIASSSNRKTVKGA